MLLDRINSPFVRANATVLQALMRLIPFLAFGDREKMHALVSHFMPYLDFDKCVCLIVFSSDSNSNNQIYIAPYARYRGAGMMAACGLRG